MTPACDIRSPRPAISKCTTSRTSCARAPAHPLVLSGLNAAESQELSRHLGDAVPPAVRLDIWHVNGPTGVADGFGDDPERWVFGSGHPVQTPQATMLQLMASRLSADDLAKVTSV